MNKWQYLNQKKSNIIKIEKKSIVMNESSIKLLLNHNRYNSQFDIKSVKSSEITPISSKFCNKTGINIYFIIL